MIKLEWLERSFTLLDEVFAAGGNTFDTAHGYNGGDSERTLGRWIQERGVREQVVIIGKGAHPYQGRNRVTPQDITADILESLQRMGLDSIDLYLLHGHPLCMVLVSTNGTICWTD
jgi:aryl-alcohol dehydrogenase-like predicted oxidoreductase